MDIQAVLRRFQPVRVAKAEVDLRVTHAESLAVATVEAPGHEMTRSGRRFYLAYNGTVPTGIAPVQAFPTTAAQWTIWNADPSRTYFFEQLGAMVFSGTTGLGGELLATIFQTPASSGGNQTGTATMSASGSNLTSKAIIKSGVTITGPAAPVWSQIAEQVSSAAIVGPASCIASRPGYRSIVALPPGFGLGLAVLAPAGTTPLYLPIAEWVELESDME